jgi:hypothetical protein
MAPEAIIAAAQEAGKAQIAMGTPQLGVLVRVRIWYQPSLLCLISFSLLPLVSSGSFSRHYLP